MRSHPGASFLEMKRNLTLREKKFLIGHRFSEGAQLKGFSFVVTLENKATIFYTQKLVYLLQVDSSALLDSAGYTGSRLRQITDHLIIHLKLVFPTLPMINKFFFVFFYILLHK